MRSLMLASLLLVSHVSSAQVLAVDPTFIEVTATVGDAIPPQAVTIRNSSRGALKWTVVRPAATWLTVSPTRGTNNGTLTVSVAGLNAVGTYATTFTVFYQTQVATVTVTVTLTAAPLPPPPPPQPPPTSTSTRGPSSSVVCPAGAIRIVPGSSIQSAVNQAAAGATFCLAAGIHAVTSAVTPKSGDTFIGEYGAVLDGTGWVTTDGTQAAFRAHNQDIDDITIKNLVIRNMPQRGIHAYSQYADRWTIQHNDIYNAVTGIVAPNVSVITDNIIHDNRDASGGGGGWIIFRATDVVIANNEVYGNGAETKIAHAFNVIVRQNYFHDATYNGVWFDGDSPGSIVEDNVIDDTPITAIFLEVAQRIIVRRNTIRRPGWNGIYLATSRDMDVYDNIIEDAGSIALAARMECNRGGLNGGGELTSKWDFTGNRIHHNVVRVPAGPLKFAVNFILDETITPCADRAQYLDNAKDNQWVGNQYTVPDATGRYWAWSASPQTYLAWPSWAAIPQDATGSVRVP